jgi:hypothetical protein
LALGVQELFVLHDSLIVLLEGEDDGLAQLLPLLLPERLGAMRHMVVVKPQRRLDCVHEGDHQLVEHDRPGSAALFLGDVELAAVVAEERSEIGEQFGEDSAFVVFGLRDGVGRTVDEHVLLFGVAVQVQVELELVGLCYLVHQALEEVDLREEGFVLGLELAVEVHSCCPRAGVAKDDAVGVDHGHNHEDDAESQRGYFSRSVCSSGDKQRSVMMVEMRRELLVSLGCSLPVTTTTRFLALSSPLPTITTGMLMPVRVFPRTATSACSRMGCKSCSSWL